MPTGVLQETRSLLPEQKLHGQERSSSRPVLVFERKECLIAVTDRIMYLNMRRLEFRQEDEVESFVTGLFAIISVKLGSKIELGLLQNNDVLMEGP